MAAVTAGLKVLRVAAIVGSLRSASVNRGVFRALQAEGAKHGLEIFEVPNDFPLFNRYGAAGL
jgi:NAD(P)H-dependent FMN reductase